MTNFWQYEDKRTYDKRMADSFQQEATKYLWGDTSGRDQPNAMPDALKQSDLNALVPKQPGSNESGGSFLGHALGFVDDVSSGIFMGKVRAPWDILRPIARLSEAETKYIAHPLARKLFETAGVNYDELPGIAQMGIEAVTSPSSWIGIGLLGKGAKALKLAPGLARFAAAESLPEYLLKNAIPNIAGSLGSGAAQELGLPPWVGLPIGLASSKGVDFYYGQSGAIKSLPKGTQMSIVLPDSMEVFHGSTADVQRISPGDRISGNPFSGGGSSELGPSTRYRHAPPGQGGFTGIYFTTEPRSYETEAWGAKTQNVLPTIQELQDLKPYGTVPGAASTNNLNIIKLSPDPEKLAAAQKLRDAGIPQTPTQSTARYSVSEPAMGQRLATGRSISYFDNEQDVLDYVSSVGEGISTFDSNTGQPGPRWGNPKADTNARIYPALVQPGTKLFNPHVDPAPPTLAKALEQDPELRRNLAVDADPNSQASVPVFHSDVFNRQQRAAFQQELMDQGYAGYQTRHELLIWDDKALVPLFEARGREWDTAEGLRKATQQNPGLAMSVPALAEAFPAAGSARAIGSAIMGDAGESKSWLQDWQDSLDLARDPEKFKAAQEAKRAQVAKELEARAKASNEQGKLTGRASKMTRISDQLSGKGAGAMRAQPEAFANRVTQVFESGVPDVFGWRSTEDALTHAYQNRSFTQWFREKVADHIPQGWVDWAENQGYRFRDDELSYLIRARAEKLHQGDTYAATLADLQQGIINKQGVANRDVRVNGQMQTVVTDPVVVASAKALEATRPGLKLLDAGGRLYLDDMLKFYKVLGLSADQEAWATSMHQMTNSLAGLETAMKLKTQGFDTPDGWDVHRQPLSRPVTVQDPKSLADYQVKIDEGPVLRSRYGSNQAAGKPREVATKAEGMDAGISYLPFIEAQRARYAQGWRLMADDWLKTATSDIGRKPSQLIDPTISSALTDSIELRRQYNWLESELKASLARPMKNSFRAPRFQIRPELKDMFEQASWTGAISKQDQRLAGWRAVRERLMSEKAPWEANYEGLSSARKEALKTVQAFGTTDFPVDFGGQRYPLREGRQLAQLVKPAGTGLAEQTLGAFNKNIRPLMATLDASFMGIQGLMSFFVDPGAWFGALKHGVFGDYDAYLHSAYQSGLLDTAREAGVYYAARNDFGEFLFPKSVLSIPGVGKAADVSNTWFTNFGNVLRLEMFNVGVKGGMDVTQLEKLGRTVNLATGFNPGKPTSVETIATFAPRFFRAQLGLLTDSLTKTVTKDQQGSLGIDLSRASAARNVGQMVALGSALTVGVNTALGQGTDFDPTSSNFMRIRGLDRDISIFGPWDSLVRAMSTLATDGPDAAAVYLARSKASPAIGRVIDIIQGETFTGEKLKFGSASEIAQTALSMAKSSGPISLTSMLNEGIPTDPAAIAGTGIGFLGVKASPLSGYEQLVNTQEDLARSHFNKPWDQLEPFQKDELRKKYDLALESSTDIQKAFDFRAQIDKRFNARQLELDNELPIGKDWIDARQKLHQEQVGAYGQWAEQNPEAAARIRAGKPSNPNDQVRQQYYSIFDKANQESWTPAETSEALTQFEAGLSTDQKAYLDRNLGLKDTPRVREYKAAQDTLRPYWQFADEVWDKYKTRSDVAAKYGSIQEYQNDLIQQYQDQGLNDQRILERLRDNPLMRQVQRATDVVRMRYREQHREVDKLLTKWYGYTPVSQSR